MNAKAMLFTLVVVGIVLLSCGSAMAFGTTSFQIGNCVWLDTNNNTTTEAADLGLNGVLVTLEKLGADGTWTPVTSMPTYPLPTDQQIFTEHPFLDGYYNFGSLPPATYRVTVSGTGTDKNGDTYKLSNVEPIYDFDGIATSDTAQIQLTASTKLIDFGYKLPDKGNYSLGDTVWLDDGNGNPVLAANGIQDNGEQGIANVVVALVDGNGDAILDANGDPVTTTTDANGKYLFSLLKAGTYATIATPPTGYDACTYSLDGLKDSDSGNVNLPSAAAVEGSPDDLRLDFGYVAAGTGGFCTFTQGGWGAVPKGNNPGTVLTNNWLTVYPSSVLTVGGLHFLRFTTPAQITVFLPQGGTAAPLTSDYNPPTKRTEAGVLAGQVVALQLNVDFSVRGITKFGISLLKIQSGPFAGKTVAEFLGIARAALGGATGYSISAINDTATKINESFDNGTTNTGYIK